jgi:hypothetical protein
MVSEPSINTGADESRHHGHRSSSGHSGDRTRRRYRKRSSRHKKSLSSRLKKSTLRFLKKYRVLLFVLVAAFAITFSLLWVFGQMERQTVNQYSKQEAYE